GVVASSTSVEASMSQIIPIIDLDIHKRLVKARRVIEKYVPAEKLNSFKLSYKEGKRNVYVVPLSGGSDSTCMAILLKVLFPEVPFVFVFCDTQAESEDLYENLDRLERWAGIQIVRIVPELGLVDYINKYNGFLPSQQARWCTPKLKIEPLDEWFKQNYDLGGNDMIWTHVGIRADETRFGYVSESGEVEMQLPYVKLGIDRSAVYGILSETIGIAPNYRWNSRSSCYCCFFKRRSEKIGLLLNRPHEFDSAA